MATMDPYTTGKTFCLLERAGFAYCPGNGLGHSIAFFFRGEFVQAFKSNIFGPFAIIILSHRIIKIWIEIYAQKKINEKGVNHA